MKTETPVVLERNFPFYSGPGIAFILISAGDIYFQIMFCPYFLTKSPIKTAHHPLHIRLVKCFIGGVNQGEPVAEFVSLYDGFEGAKSLVYSMIYEEDRLNNGVA